MSFLNFLENKQKANREDLKEPLKEALRELWGEWEKQQQQLQENIPPLEQKIYEGQTKKVTGFAVSSSVEYLASEAAAATDSPTAILGLAEELKSLRDDFEKKFGEHKDCLIGKLHEELQHKNDLIDKLHEELQKYKSDLLYKLTQPLFIGIITLCNQLKDDVRWFKKKDELNPEELLESFEGVPKILEEILFRQGVRPFASEPGTPFTPLRHKAKIPHMQSRNKNLDKTVYETIRPGYEIDGRLLTEEVVRVQVFVEPSIAEPNPVIVVTTGDLVDAVCTEPKPAG